MPEAAVICAQHKDRPQQPEENTYPRVASLIACEKIMEVSVVNRIIFTPKPEFSASGLARNFIVPNRADVGGGKAIRGAVGALELADSEY